MILTCCTNSDGVFKREYRKQLLVSLSVLIITFCHGIGLGWLSPMLAKLQSPIETPLNFVVNVEEASWIGALVCLGGFTGNALFGFLLDRIGRKKAIYALAFPHMCLWCLVYFANSVEYLYVARVCGGITGGGIYIVMPIFIGEIADSSIRGRLTSLFTLTLNTGIMIGFILSTHLPYHLIPCVVIGLPIFYLMIAIRYPETPQHLLRQGHEQLAMESLQFYRNYEPNTKADIQEFNSHFTELKMAVLKQKTHNVDASFKDFLEKRSLMALATGMVLMMLNIFSGTFALINYMSSIFAATKTELHPDTNTIIIGAIQIVGTYTATILVDRYGRKILITISTAGMGIALATFGLYAFVAEETDTDLSQLSRWLPLTLVACIIFMSNIGIIPITFVILVEIMPAKIRSKASTICLGLLSAIAFAMMKVFPIFMHVFGLAASMWFCSSVCAFGLFYLSIFLKETKGKSLDKDDDS